MKNLKKKVIIVSERFFPESEAIAIRMKNIADEFIKNDQFHLKIITATREPDSSNYNTIKTFFSGSLRTKGIILRFFRECLFGIEVCFRLLFIRYDLVIITSPPFFSGLLASLGVLIKKKKYILDIRDYYPRVIFDLGLLNQGSWIGRSLLYFEKKWYTHADKIFTVNQVIQSDIQVKVPKHIKNTFVMANGFDQHMFTISREKYLDFTVVFHANLAKLHNIDLLLKIVRMSEQAVPQVQFMVIGDGPEAYKIKETCLKNINYLGKVPYGQIPELIKKAHIGLSLLQDNNLTKGLVPVKVYEYIGVGIPIVCAPSIGKNNIIQQNQLGYSHSVTDVSGIVATIQMLHKNKELYMKTQENIKKSRMNYSRQKMANAYFKEVANSLEK